MNLDDLRFHPFVKRALADSVNVQVALGDTQPVKVKPAYARDPDEHEFYVLRVGHAIAELLTMCDQIAHSVVYLGSYSRKPAFEAAGVTRGRHLLYHIENHIIRTHSLYDRSLQLVDATFHLLNASTECSHKVVTSNLKVARTNIPAVLKQLRAILGKTLDTRHEVIHRQSFKEDALRQLEMYCILEDSSTLEETGPLSPPAIAHRIRELARQLIKAKKKEFTKINANLFEVVARLFSALEPIYIQEKKLVDIRASTKVT
jgi:Cthe_2314-like HEPN